MRNREMERHREQTFRIAGFLIHCAGDSAIAKSFANGAAVVEIVSQS